MKHTKEERLTLHCGKKYVLVKSKKVRKKERNYHTVNKYVGPYFYEFIFVSGDKDHQKVDNCPTTIWFLHVTTVMHEIFLLIKTQLRIDADWKWQISCSCNPKVKLQRDFWLSWALITHENINCSTVSKLHKMQKLRCPFKTIVTISFLFLMEKSLSIQAYRLGCPMLTTFCCTNDP